MGDGQVTCLAVLCRLWNLLHRMRCFITDLMVAAMGTTHPLRLKAILRFPDAVRKEIIQVRCSAIVSRDIFAMFPS